MAATSGQDEPLELTSPAAGAAITVDDAGTTGERSDRGNAPPLRRVAGHIPWAAWLIAFVAFWERFAYYGLTTPLQNYIQNDLNDRLRPGALGLGQTTATNLSYVFAFVGYTTPVLGGMLADNYLGRFRTLGIFMTVYLCGVFVLFATSLPAALHNGAGLPGLITSLLVMGLGVGGVKACIAPFVADQCTDLTTREVSRKDGERVVIDADASLEHIYSVFYWCQNAGSLSGLATTWMEKKVGFWAANLLCFFSLGLAAAGLLLARRRLVDKRPQGSILNDVIRVLWYSARGGCRLKSAKPAIQRERHGKSVRWDDGFVDDIGKALATCRVFLAFIVYWLCQNQMATNLVSQAGDMDTHGLPNDALASINAAAVLVLLPAAQYALYPALRRRGIDFAPARRLALGFVAEAAAMAYAAGVQRAIYGAPPCFRAPRQCAAAPNRVHVLLQAPVYVLEAAGEVLATPAAYEYAYARAPARLRTLVQAALLLTAAAGTLLGLALSPAYRHPHLLVMYACLAGLMFGTACVFAYFFCYRRRER